MDSSRFALIKINTNTMCVYVLAHVLRNINRLDGMSVIVCHGMSIYNLLILIIMLRKLFIRNMLRLHKIDS